MSIVIEKASSKDAALLLEFFKQIGGETDNLTFGMEGLPISVEAEAAFISKMENSFDNIMLIAKENGKIVGNASLSRLPRRMGHRGEFKVNSFEIIDLQVRSDNKRAIHMYEKFGFEKVGAHPAFFKIDNEYISFDYMYLKLM